jgi:hypothetical protein
MSQSHYCLAIIQDEVRQLVRQGAVDQRQPIYILCKFMPARIWAEVELELEANDFLLRDRIADLIPCNEWDND